MHNPLARRVELAGKVALVTGAARGIGLATAELLAARGTRVVITDVDGSRLSMADEELRARGFRSMALECDVSDPERCALVVDAVVERLGALDVLVNNAGISVVDSFDACRPAVCRRVVEVNLLGSIYMTLAALEELKRARGHLVFVSSVSGIRAIPKGSVYSATKAALRSLAESLRVELGPAGVHVGVVSPGFTTSAPDKTVLRGDGNQRPIDRPPHDTPEGVARAIVKLIERRERERVLTPLGRATALVQRLAPSVLDRLLALHDLRN